MSPIEVAHSLPTGATVATVAAEGYDLGSAVRAWAKPRADRPLRGRGRRPPLGAAVLPDPLAHPRRRAVRARLHPPRGRARRARRRPRGLVAFHGGNRGRPSQRNRPASNQATNPRDNNARARRVWGFGCPAKEIPIRVAL